MRGHREDDEAVLGDEPSGRRSWAWLLALVVAAALQNLWANMDYAGGTWVDNLKLGRNLEQWTRFFQQETPGYWYSLGSVVVALWFGAGVGKFIARILILPANRRSLGALLSWGGRSDSDITIGGVLGWLILAGVGAVPLYYASRDLVLRFPIVMAFAVLFVGVARATYVRLRSSSTRVEDALVLRREMAAADGGFDKFADRPDVQERVLSRSAAIARKAVRVDAGLEGDCGPKTVWAAVNVFGVRKDEARKAVKDAALVEVKLLERARAGRNADSRKK